MRNEKDNMTLQEAALLHVSRTAALWVLLAIASTILLLLFDGPAVALSVGAVIAAGGGGIMLMRGSRVPEEYPLDNPVWTATASRSRPPVSEARSAVADALLYAHHICARFCAGIAVILCAGGFFFA